MGVQPAEKKERNQEIFTKYNEMISAGKIQSEAEAALAVVYGISTERVRQIVKKGSRQK